MIKRFKRYLNEKKIKDSCKKLGIYDIQINEDLSVDIKGDVSLDFYDVKDSKLPFKFNHVWGNFTVNGVKSLEGCPSIVEGDFNWVCPHTKILDHCPESIAGRFYLETNIVTIKKFPKRIGGGIWMHHNPIDWMFQLGFRKSCEFMEYVLEYGVQRGENQIYLKRLSLALEDCDRYHPEGEDDWFRWINSKDHLGMKLTDIYDFKYL